MAKNVIKNLEGLGINIQDLIKMLNSAYADELLAWA